MPTRVDLNKNSDDLFTRVFYHVRRTTKRYVVVYGGSASSKSYSVHQNELFRLMQQGKGDTLFLRKYGVDHLESCYKLLKYLINEYGLSRDFKFTYSNGNRRITYTPTGRCFVFKGLDDAEKIKSIVGFNRIVIEEANQVEFDDFTEVLRRARGFSDIQFTLILNPVSEHHWIKTQLCDPAGAYYEKTEVHRFTYHDNGPVDGGTFLTEDDIDNLERLKRFSENQYRVYALGEWGVEDKNKKFVWAFDAAKNLKATEYNRERVTWASFDFNVNPLTCTIFQVYAEIMTLRAIECFKLENSDIWKMCDRLVTGYPNALWKITGDATGRNRQAISQDNLNYYEVIREKLRLGNGHFIIPNVNPPVEENQLVVNAAFKLWNVEIDPVRCKPLIYDVTYVEIDEKKQIVKDRSNDKRYSDFLDTLRYFINVAVKPYLDLGRAVS